MTEFPLFEAATRLIQFLRTPQQFPACRFRAAARFEPRGVRLEDGLDEARVRKLEPLGGAAFFVSHEIALLKRADGRLGNRRGRALADHAHAEARAVARDERLAEPAAELPLGNVGGLPRGLEGFVVVVGKCGGDFARGVEMRLRDREPLGGFSIRAGHYFLFEISRKLVPQIAADDLELHGLDEFAEHLGATVATAHAEQIADKFFGDAFFITHAEVLHRPRDRRKRRRFAQAFEPFADAQPARKFSGERLEPRDEFLAQCEDDFQLGMFRQRLAHLRKEIVAFLPPRFVAGEDFLELIEDEDG